MGTEFGLLATLTDINNTIMIRYDRRSGSMIERFTDISFSEKVRIYSYDFLKSCVYIKSFGLDSKQFIFTKKLFSKLISNSQLLEDFLDFHGAKNNKTWYFYRELSAAVRHLSLAGYSQQHILNRLLFYELNDTQEFLKEAERTQRFITKSLMKLAPLILDEANRLNIEIPKGNYNQINFPGVLSGELLEYDIDDENIDQQEKNIVKIASEFLNIVKSLDYLGIYEECSIEDIKKMVPQKVNEVEIRRFEMLVHNLQSSFDSYVIHGGYRYGNRQLKQLRGHFSVVFHLLQIIGRLLHFYERHIHEVGYKELYIDVRNRLASYIKIESILDRIINYGLFYAYKFLSDGKLIAKGLLNEYTERGKITVGIPVTRGFHSRPSLLVAKIVEHYGGPVELQAGDATFDASSVLDIQWAGGKIQKEKITKVHFIGDTRALKDIEILAGINYGEDTMGKGIPLPDTLKYLR